MEIGLKRAGKLISALLICIAFCSGAFAQTISFTNSILAGDGALHEPTSLQFGPDGRLYVAERYGKIFAYTILRNSPNNYQIVGTEVITKIQEIPNHNDDGTPNPAVTTRQVTGIVVTGTAANPVLFVTSSDPREGGGSGTAVDKDQNLDTNSGVISRLTWNGTSWDRVDLVRGLPRSEENHSPNGLAYDKVNNILYMAQGGNTNMGAPSNNFAYLPEYAYSTAILKIDLNAITTPPYDLPTLDDETRSNDVNGKDINDPFGGNDGLNQAVLVPGGPVTIYSPGWRNNFDVCIMQTGTYAGKMYSFDNGSNGGWGGTPIGCSIDVNEGGINQGDALHYVSGPGYYAGFPNPVRANRSITFNASNPQTPIPLGMENPVECTYIGPGSNGAISVVNGSSTNGLCEYTASNFGGTMKGQLLAASFNGRLYRYKLNAAGDGVIGGNITLAQNFGFTPLDVTAQGDNDIFPGTIWVTLHGSHDIAVFEPNDFASCAGDANSMILDDDADGYSNGDETLNGTDKCNPSSKPDDFDGDKISNLLDPDDDNDGIADNVDKFAQDPLNGTATTIPVLHTYQNSNEGGIGGWAFTGLMCNNVDDYQTLYDMDNMTVGGAAYKFTIDNVPNGDALGALNNQKYAYQFGVNAGAFPFGYTVHGRVMTPFGGSPTPPNYRSLGIFIGTGDQDNYLKIVCAANGGAGGIEIVKEEGGVPSATMHPAAILGATHVNFYLDVNPTTHMVQPAYSIGGGAKTNLGPAISVPASWLNNVLAVGFIATSRGTTSFPATWDYIAVDPVEGVGNWVNVNTVNTCTARHESAFVQCGNKFYILGGRLTKPVESYDYINKNWTTHVAPPIQLHHFQAVELNGLIYVVGAFTGTFPNETPVPNVYIYDPIANLWHVGMEIPAARRRGSAGAVVYNGKIYLVSGLTNGHVSGWVPWVDVFDPQKNTWQTLPDIPHMRDHFQVALHGDQIYAIGGRNSGRDGTYGYTIPETDVYDISEQTWTSLPSPEGDIPTQRAACALAVLGDEILAIGGESMAHSSAHKQTEALDVNTHSWRTLDELNTGRHGTQAIVNNFGVYIAAGCGNRGGSPELNSVEAFYLYGQTTPTGTPVSKGAISVSSGNLNFGNVHLGNSATQTLYITNPNGNQALLIKGLSLTTGTGNYSFATNYTMPIVVNVGDTLAVDVTFAPTSTGTKTGNLQIASSTGVVNTNIGLTGVSVGQQTSIRINAGGPDYTTAAAENYIADAYYTNFAGSTSTTAQPISGTTEEALYQNERYGAVFGYKVPVQNGSYTVNLHFAEIWAGASNAGVRVFDVKIENALVIDDLDLYSVAGMYTAYVRTFNVTVNDGELNIDFASSVNNAKINAIEIIAPTATQGILTAVPSTVTFPVTDVNIASVPIPVSLTNTGGASLTINSVSIGGTNASNFIHSFTTPVTVAVGATTTVNVTFTPSSSGAKTATMTLNHTGSNTPLTVSLNGTGSSNTTNCGYFVEQNGLLVVEIENSPATEGWTSETAYTNYTGSEYYTWTGPNYFNEKGHGMLSYQFKINNPGRYRFKMRTRNGGPLNTHNNDVWVRFPDHGCVFVKNGQVVEEKSGWWKEWQNNLNVWTYNTWAGESTFWEVYVDFPFAGVYSMDISGRAQLYSLDRFVLFRQDMVGDWAATSANPPQSPWENCPSTPLVWYRDADLDYYGTPNDSVISVAKPGVGYVWNKLDCDDGQKTVYPGAPELLDGRDNDCDGTIDEGAYLTSLAINCGGSQYTTINGELFESDRLFSLPSGAKFHSGVGDIMNTDDDNLFKSERNTTISNNLSYNFKAHPGLYTVTLYFVEQATVMNPGERVMDVMVEDSIILNDFDIIATAGYKTAYSYTYNLRLLDTMLNVKLIDVVGKAKINAIKVAQRPNTPPNFTISGNSTFNEDFAGTATLTITPAAVPPHEAYQTVTYSIAPASVAFANVSINPTTGQVSISAVPNMNGQQQFTVTANDGYATNNIATKTFTLKVLAVNDPPAFTVSGDITEDEDFTGTKTVTVIPAPVPSDEASQTVTYSLSPASVSFATVSFNTATGEVSVTSLPEMSGTQVFTITANDGQAANNTATATFTLTVTATNDPPALNAISDVTINEDAGMQTVSLSGISAGPNETQTLTISAVSDNPSLVPNPTVNYTSPNATGSLNFTPVANNAGVAHITVTVSDGSLTVDRTFTVTVNAVNDAPVFTLSGNITVTEDFTTTEHVTVTPGTVAPDEVGQTVTYSLSPASVSFANVSINSSTGEVTITSVANKSGSQVFTVTADDGQSSNNTHTQTFTLTVTAVNDAPVFTLNTNNITVTEDFATAQHVSVTTGAVPADEASQTVTYNLSPASVSFANVSINSATGEVTITAVANATGTQVFTVTANDGQSSNNTHAQTFTLTVTGENDAPVFTLSGDVTVNEDFASAQHVTVTPGAVPADEASQTVTYSLSPASVSFANVSINSTTGEVTITAIPNVSGTQVFTVTADDGQSSNNTYSQTFTLTVNSVNDAPVFTLSGNVTVDEDFTTTETVTVTPGFVPANETSQTVTYSLSPASVAFANVSINSSTGVVTITSVADAAGSQVFTVTANDGQSSNNTHTQTFTLTVNSVNDAPVFTLSGDVSVLENQYTQETVTVTPAPVPANEQSQTVTYTLSPPSVTFANVSINSSTGKVTITPVQDQFGSQVFTVTANDGQSSNNTYSQTFTLNVDQGNTPPTFTINRSAITKNEDFTTTETVIVTPDPVRPYEQSQVVTYTLSPASVSFANISFDSNTGNVTITAVANASGSQVFTITADDGEAINNTHEETFTLTVTAVNDAPAFVLSGDVVVSEDFTTTEHVTVTPAAVPADEASQTVTYTLTPPSVPFANISFDSNTGEVTITSIANASGTQLFTVKANDGQAANNTHQENFLLTVSPINDQPTLDPIANPAAVLEDAGIKTVNLTGITAGGGETQTLTVSVSSDNPLLFSTLTANYTSPATTGTITYEPAPNQWGSATVTVTVDDGQAANNTITRTFIITVTAVNDEPAFTMNPASLTLAEDFAGTQTVSVVTGSVPTDEAGQTVTYSLTPPTVPFANIVFNTATGEMQITAIANMNGSRTFTITANDGQTQNGTHAETFVLTVTAVNDPPVFTVNNGVTVFKNFTSTETISVTEGAVPADEVSQTVTYSLQPASVPFANVSLNSGSGTVTITSIANMTGTQTFTLTANDGQSINNTHSEQFTFSVVDTNYLPTLSAITSPAAIDEDAGLQTVHLNGISAGFNESQPVSVTAVSDNPALISPVVHYINPDNTGTVEYTPAANQFGTATITVTVDDGQSANNSVSRTFTVVVNPVNDEPLIDAITNPAAILEDAGTQIIPLTGISAGPYESEAVTITASSSNPSLIADPAVTYSSPATTGTLQYAPAANQSGTATITVTVDDGQAVHNITTRTFTVTVTPVNDPPVVTDVIKAGQEDKSVGFIASNFTDEYTDIENDPMTKIRIMSLPQHGTLTLNATPVVVVAEIAALDAKNLVYEPANGFTGVDSFLWNGYDGQLYAVTPAKVIININSVNDKPEVVSHIPDITVNEDHAPMADYVNLGNIFNDEEDGSNLTYSVVLNTDPVLVQLSIGTDHTLDVSFAANGHGSSTVVIQAMDAAGATATDTFSVTVNSVEDAPSVFHLLTPTNGSVVGYPSAIDFTWEESVDGDGDDVEYSVFIKGHKLDTVMNGVAVAALVFNGEHLFTPDSTYKWYVVATDGDDTQTSATFGFKVSITGINSVDVLVNGATAYPNPFGSQVTISYSLKTEARVKVRILNFLGQEVAVIANEKQITGEHKVVWDSASSATGVYFFELELETKNGVGASFTGKIIKN